MTENETPEVLLVGLACVLLWAFVGRVLVDTSTFVVTLFVAVVIVGAEYVTHVHLSPLWT